MNPQLASIEEKIDRIQPHALPSNAHLNCIQNLVETDQPAIRSGLKTAKGQIVPGTCDWILDDPTYQNWLSSTTQFLWISGGPGMGKTMLSIYLSEHLERHCASQGGDDVTIYFFCGFKDRRLSNAVSVLRSLMFQLICHNSSLAGCILPAYGLYRNRLFDDDMFEKLWDIFLAMITGLGPSATAYCVIDGLDECQPDSLHHLLAKLELLRATEPGQQQPLPFKGLFVSREHPSSITSAFATALRIQLDRESNSSPRNGLGKYISTEVDNLARPANKGYSADLSNRVKQALLRRSEGTYLWVSFIIRELQDKVPSEVEETLKHLPNGLDDMYARLISQFKPDRVDQIRELLGWCLLAQEPLSLAALIDAMGIKATQSLTALQILQDRVAYCLNLVVVAGDQVRFYHQTVEDYLLYGGTASLASRSSSDLAPFNKPQGHAKLASRCLDYLQESLPGQHYKSLGRWDLKRSNPFLFHAIHFWHYHLRESGPAMLAVIDTHTDFFGQKSDLRKEWYSLRTEKLLPDTDILPPNLHLFAWLGLDDLLVRMLKPRRRRLLLNSPFGEQGLTPLICAIDGGWLSTCEILVSRGANVNAEFSNKRHTPLIRAIHQNGAVLLGFFHSHSDWIFDDPLEASASSSTLDLYLPRGRRRQKFRATSSPSIVKLLISAGARVNGIRSSTPWSARPLRPLCEAVSAEQPSLEIVKLLVENGADPMKMDTGGHWPLSRMLASHNWSPDSKDIMKYLLTLYESVDFVAVTTSEGKTLVHWAAQNGDADMLRALVGKWKLNPCPKDSQGLTPLHLAVEFSNHEVIKSLIQEWSVRPHPGGHAKAPVAHALAEILGDTDRLQTVKMFIDDYGVDPNEVLEHTTTTSQGKINTTLLHEAAKYGRNDIIDFLISRGANLNVYTTGSRTMGHEYELTTYETYWDCSINLCYNSPLCLAIVHGNPETVKTLIEHGVDPEEPCRSCCGCRPIHIAAQYDKLRGDMIKRLVEDHGVDPKARDLSGRTALHHAVTMGNSAIVDYLLQTLHTDPNATSHDGNTPLHDLATADICQVVQWSDVGFMCDDQDLRDHAKGLWDSLREAGADPSRRNAAGKTPRECLGVYQLNYAYLKSRVFEDV